MQLSQSFSLLFTSLLFALTFSFGNIADAKPPPTDFGKIITLPVKPYHHINITDVHPLIALQRHINHGLVRLAHMSGSPQPSREQLTENLERRVRSIEDLERRKLSDEVDTFAAATGKIFARERFPVTPANQPSAEKSLGLDINFLDISYMATIQIGTPPRDFSILMDSGSADFWVGSETCSNPTYGTCGNHVFLGPLSSSSFTNSGKAFFINYFKGNITGSIIKDDVSIAGLTLKQHTFGVATEENIQFSRFEVPSDGVMGLAKSSLSLQKTLTPVEALVKAGLMDASIVSYKLSRLEDGKNDGVITFGGLDTTKYDPETLVTLDSISTSSWIAKVEGLTIDGTSALNFQGRVAMLDTGTSLVFLPYQDAIDIHSQIPGATPDGQGGFSLPCNTSTVISLTFGNRAFDIDPRDLTVYLMEDGRCTSGISSTTPGPGGLADNVWLLGSTFLKNVYFSTNADKNTLSLAKLV